MEVGNRDHSMYKINTSDDSQKTIFRLSLKIKNGRDRFNDTMTLKK